MKLLKRSILPLACLVVATQASALQTTAPAAPAAATTVAANANPGDPAKTRAYIAQAWKTLTRSIDDCSGLVDPKVKGRPVVYVPADITVPDTLKAAGTRCKVDVRPLPQKIERLGQIDATTLPAQGLLYLPHPYVVPGGFFNEMYGWDSYFIVLGLVADRREAMARNMVDNFLYEVAHYGAVLNANRSYYLSRSQPPFLGEMIREVLDDPASFPDRQAADAWLAQAYPVAVRDHDIWLMPEHRAGDTGLARYFDLGHGPVLELHAAAYPRQVITWLLAHKDRDRGYLIQAPQRPDAAQAATLARTSCDVRISPVCADAWVQGYRLSQDYYTGDRANRESGFDTNFHLGPFGGSTHHYAEVGLNSLLYRYEKDLAAFAQRLGKADDARRWEAAAVARKAAVDKYLWRPELHAYCDYDFTTGKPATDPYLSSFYPLWAGLASAEQAKGVRASLPAFERLGGLAMSQNDSGAQWDQPFGWAPTNWLAVKGLDDYGFHDDAHRLATKFNATIDRSLAHDGTIREKYNMVTGNAQVTVTAGYSTNVIGFGWSNGVYLKMRQLLDGATGTPATAGSPR